MIQDMSRIDLFQNPKNGIFSSKTSGFRYFRPETQNCDRFVDLYAMSQVPARSDAYSSSYECLVRYVMKGFSPKSENGQICTTLATRARISETRSEC